ncbi:MAG TPA: hypothetical protein VFL85_00365, partial [Candidatus Saccharimonadales bacterium]|nr:hypothetical protein [Candidatus Saccharimonadales bacterium]
FGLMYAVVFHAHQKIDRVASRLLRELPGTRGVFPTAAQIINFEGKRGPDATRLKKAEDIEQPWHFMDPFNDLDEDLPNTIADHYKNLVKALKDDNEARAAFEAAWLAHALVDGLTPAHHYPYETELDLLHGESRAERTKISQKFIAHGDTRRDTLRRSLKIIGPKGLLTTHTMFEAGAYMIMRPMRLQKALPTEDDIEQLRGMGLITYFRMTAKEVGALGMFDKYYKTGWTPKLARLVRRELAPRMVKIVVLAWYSALMDSGIIPESAKEKA